MKVALSNVIREQLKDRIREQLKDRIREQLKHRIREQLKYRIREQLKDRNMAMRMRKPRGSEVRIDILFIVFT